MEQAVHIMHNQENNSCGQSVPLPLSFNPIPYPGICSQTGNQTGSHFNNFNNHFHQTESSQDSLSTFSGDDPSNKKKPRKQVDRFNGMSEEEVMQKMLPDHLREDLDIVIIGINPSLTAAHVGHHYAGPGNHFWSCVTEAGLVPGNVTCYDDSKMIKYSIGFTNVCARPTKGAADLTRKEMKEGAEILIDKLKKCRPKISVFNGKGIYESFVGHKHFCMGKQPEPLPGTNSIVFVMPSSSARCAQLPRAADKLPFYVALKKLRDYVRGECPAPPNEEVVFPDYAELRISQPDPKSLAKAERRRKHTKKKPDPSEAASPPTSVGPAVSANQEPIPIPAANRGPAPPGMIYSRFPGPTFPPGGPPPYVYEQQGMFPGQYPGPYPLPGQGQPMGFQQSMGGPPFVYGNEVCPPSSDTSRPITTSTSSGPPLYFAPHPTLIYQQQGPYLHHHGVNEGPGISPYFQTNHSESDNFTSLLLSESATDTNGDDPARFSFHPGNNGTISTTLHTTDSSSQGVSPYFSYPSSVETPLSSNPTPTYGEDTPVYTTL